MSNNKFVIVSIILLILGLGGIFGLKYHNNLQDIIKKESSMWDKPKIIMKSGLNTNIGGVKYEDNYIVTFNNKESLEILLVNDKGEILKSSSNKLESKFINDINVNIDNNEIYITYVINIGGEKNFNILKLNEKLEVVENNKVSEVKRAISIKDKTFALVYENRIEIRDNTKLYASINEKVSDIEFINEEGKQLLIYSNSEGDCKYIELNSNFIGDPKLICKISVGQGVSYNHMSVGINENNIYLTFEQSHKNVFQDSLYYKYSLVDEKIVKHDSAKLDNTKIKKITYIGDNNFLGVIEESIGMKSKKVSLIEFTFNDNMQVVFKEKIATYNRGYDYVSKVDDILLVGIFNSVGDYDVSMVGHAQHKENHKITKNENRLLLQAVGESIVYAVGFSFIFLIISAVIYGIIFVAYSFLSILSEGNKGIIGITILLFILLIIKCYIITGRIMTMCYMYIPDNFRNIYLWIGLNGIISFIIWIIGTLDILKSKKEINLIKIYSLSLIDIFLSYTLIFAFVM